MLGLGHGCPNCDPDPNQLRAEGGCALFLAHASWAPPPNTQSCAIPMRGTMEDNGARLWIGMGKKIPSKLGHIPRRSFSVKKNPNLIISREDCRERFPLQRHETQPQTGNTSATMGGGVNVCPISPEKMENTTNPIQKKMKRWVSRAPGPNAHRRRDVRRAPGRWRHDP